MKLSIFNLFLHFRTFATAETSLSKISSKVQQSRRLLCVVDYISSASLLSFTEKIESPIALLILS